MERDGRVFVLRRLPSSAQARPGSDGVPGYQYSVTATRVGVYETLAWNWQVGDVVELHSGRGRWRIVNRGRWRIVNRGRWRIVNILDLDESDDSRGKLQAAFMVEPRPQHRA